METKHTPGEWEFSDGKIRAGQQSARPYNLASIHGHATTKGISNGKLIAAAPDLLAACIHALAVCEAEAKMRGENDTDDYLGGAAGPVAEMLTAALAKVEA